MVEAEIRMDRARGGLEPYGRMGPLPSAPNLPIPRYPFVAPVDSSTEALRDDNPVVLGSRLRGSIKDGAMSGLNYAGNVLLSWFASVLFATPISDVCSGMWAFVSDRLKSLNLTANGFDLEADIFAECALRGIPILEIPIRYDRRIGEPKLHLKEGFRIALALLKKRLRSSPARSVERRALWGRWFGPARESA